jgi:hypothetical protein
VIAFYNKNNKKLKYLFYYLMPLFVPKRISFKMSNLMSEQQKFEALYKTSDNGIKLLDENELINEFEENSKALTKYLKESDPYSGDPNYKGSYLVPLVERIKLYLEYITTSAYYGKEEEPEEEPQYCFNENWMDYYRDEQLQNEIENARDEYNEM